MMTPELAALSVAIEAKIEDAIGVQPEGAGEALLEDGGPIMEFFGPALRALGKLAFEWALDDWRNTPLDELKRLGITGPLADLCLRLSE